ncbi:MAG: hypothetical protein ACFKPT_17605 [Gloeotrichia echinulata GP01]
MCHDLFGVRTFGRPKTFAMPSGADARHSLLILWSTGGMAIAKVFTVKNGVTNQTFG